jgi:hypothetical protein
MNQPPGLDQYTGVSPVVDAELARSYATTASGGTYYKDCCDLYNVLSEAILVADQVLIFHSFILNRLSWLTHPGARVFFPHYLKQCMTD